VGSLDSSGSPRDFASRKEFFDYLYYMMISAFDKTEFGETRGHPRLLKTYMMEANSGLPKTIGGTDLIVEEKGTSLPDISILVLRETTTKKSARFYVDTSDKRFWLFHTNSLAEEAGDLFDTLVFSPTAAFDKLWLPRQMIQEIADLPRNSFRGFGLYYKDLFEPSEQTEKPVKWLRMGVSGSSSIDALEALRSKKKILSSLAYSNIRVRRGDPKEYVIDELGYEGRFIARRGNSIDAYVSLIELTRQKYRSTLEAIERNSLGVKQIENRTLMQGQAFDLCFTREIEDMNLFIDILTNSKRPFRIWGLKNKVTEDGFQVFAVDLHTGDSIDLEVSPYLIRLYLPEGSCGNTVLRLYTNLQHFFDSELKLNEEPLQTGE
jgi:hypothetical protein